MRVHPAIYHLFKFTIRLLLVLVFAGIPVSLYLLRTVGIGFGAREALEQALSNPSLEVRIGKLLVDPFNGLVAANVSIGERENPERLLAKINRLEISLNISELINRRIVVDTLTLVRAEASIPLGEGELFPRLEARDINASIIVLGDRLRVSQLDATIECLKIRLTGEILNPLAYKPQPRDESAPPLLPPETLERILTALRETVFPSGLPVLTAEFEVDASNPSTLQIPEFRLASTSLRARSILLKKIEIQGTYTDNRLRIPVLRIHDPKGVLQASAEWDKSNGNLNASILSGLDAAPFLNVVGKDGGPLSKLSFPDPPRLSLDVKGNTITDPQGISATGEFFAPKIELAKTPFKEAEIHFSWRNGVFYARDIHAQAPRGKISAMLWAGPSDLRLNAHSSIPPSDLADLFDPHTKKFLQNMEFDDLPDISVSLRASRLDFPSITGNAHLKLGRTANRGAWIDSGVADVFIKDQCLTYQNLVINTGKGRGTGSFDYDVGRKEVRLRDIVSTLVPTDVMMWIDPRIAETIRPYRFRANPKVKVQGKVHMKDPLKNDLAIRIDAPGGIDYDLLGKTLRFGDTDADVDVIANKVVATIKDADLFDGEVDVKAVVSLDPENRVFSTNATLTRVNFAKLTNLYFDYDDSKGMVSGQYGFEARMGDEENMVGKGNLRIEDGNVFAIPVLGPFSTILGTIIPGVAYNTARLATADFTVANKKITTQNIEIAGKGFSMFGYGDIYFLNGGLDLSMRINAQGIPGLVFFPVSKLFEYHSDGTISEPHWRPKIIPRIQFPIPGAKAQKNPSR
jgi:hypothetical protein